MCAENMLFSKSSYPTGKQTYKSVHFCTLCTLFFASKDSVPRLKTAVHFCTFLYIFNVSFVSKELVPRLKTMHQISIFSVHSVHFDRSDLVNLENLLVHMNPHPDPHDKIQFPRLRRGTRTTKSLTRTTRGSSTTAPARRAPARQDPISPASPGHPHDVSRVVRVNPHDKDAMA